MFKKLLFISLILPMSLMANFTTDVLDAFDGSDAFDFNIEVSYKYEMKSSKIKREYFCDASSGDTNCNSTKMHLNGIVNANNFAYLRQDHIIEPKLRFGIYKDLEFFISMPIYVKSSRNLGFDDAARKAAADTNSDGKVDANDGTPTHNGSGNTFWNVKRTGGEDLFLAYRHTMDMPSSMNINDPAKDRQNDTDLFPEDGLSYDRSGLSTLNFGLKANLLDNDRDDTDPSWMIGFEYNVSIASPIDYYTPKRLNEIANGGTFGTYSKAQLRARLENRIDLSNTSMADGIHWMKFHTALSKRYGIADSVMSFIYEKPLLFTESVFEKHENREYYMPGSRFGFDFGVEFIPMEVSYRNPETDEKTTTSRFTIDLYLKFKHYFKGMELSEISDFIATPTVVNDYSDFYANINFRYMPNKFAQINFGTALGYTTDHILTNQAKGIDHNNDGNIDGDELDPHYGTTIYDRTTFNSINSVGSRILATEALNVKAYLNIQIQF